MGCGASAGGEHYEMKRLDGGVGGLYETRARPGESKGSPRPRRSQTSTSAMLYLPGTVVCSTDDELLRALNVQAEWKWHKDVEPGDPEPKWNEGTAQTLAADLRAEHATKQEAQYDKPGDAATKHPVDVRIKGISNSERLFDDLEEAATWLSGLGPPRRFAIPYGCRGITARGMEFFAKEAARMQQSRDLSRDVEFIAYYCDWSDDHLQPLGRVSLASLDIGANPRISVGAILRFSAQSGELPRPVTAGEGPRPTIHFGECDWPEEQLVALEVFDAYNRTESASDRDLRMAYDEWYDWALDVKQTHVNFVDLCNAVRCNPESGLSVQQVIQIFQKGLMPCEKPIGKGGRLHRGQPGRHGHTREPSVEAIELLGQNDLPLLPGVMIDVSGLGLGTYRGCIQKAIGPRQHYIDFGKVGQHTAVLKVPQQRFRGRGGSDHPAQQNWAIARVPREAWDAKRNDRALLREITESIGGKCLYNIRRAAKILEVLFSGTGSSNDLTFGVVGSYTFQADDSDEEEAEGPLGFGTLVTVGLQGRGVQDNIAAAVSVTLPSCPARRAVSLTVRSADDFDINGGLTDAGFTAIASASALCKGLTGLSIGYNKTVTALGVQALATALPRCDELQFLCLNGNESIRDSGAEALTQALPYCKKLVVLEMLCCGLGDEGARSLAKNLPSVFLQSEIDPEQRRQALLDLRLNPFTNAGVGRLHRAWYQRSLGYKVTALAISLDPDCAQRMGSDDARPYEPDDGLPDQNAGLNSQPFSPNSPGPGGGFPGSP